MAPPAVRPSLVALVTLVVAVTLEPASPLTISRRAAECAAPMRMVLSTDPDHRRRAEGIINRIRGFGSDAATSPGHDHGHHQRLPNPAHPDAAESWGRDIKGELRSEVLKMAPHYGQHTVRRWWVARGEAARAEAGVEPGAEMEVLSEGTAGSVADAGGKVVLAFFLISLLDDAGALLALFCTGCATSGNHQWIKPICSAVPFEPSEVLEQLQQAFHLTSTSLML